MGGQNYCRIYEVMSTFTSAVDKLDIRVIWHHRTLLNVISQSYCQVFVKSYKFVFEKINIGYAPYPEWQKSKSFFIHAAPIIQQLACTYEICVSSPHQ